MSNIGSDFGDEIARKPSRHKPHWSLRLNVSQEKDDIEVSYSDIVNVVKECKNHEDKIIVGDLNAEVGELKVNKWRVQPQRKKQERW